MLSSANIDPAKNQGEESDGDARKRIEDSEYMFICGHRLKITDVLLSAFTFLLFLVTGSLIVVGALQHAQMKRAVDSSEDTAHTIERAYVQMSHVTKEGTPNIAPGHTGKPGTPENPGLIVDVSIGICRASIGVKNHGSTPARVTRVFITKRVMGDYLPTIPDYTPDVGEPSEQPLEAFLMKDVEIFIGFISAIDPSDIPLIRERKKQLVLYGFVEYTDQFGRHFRGGYARNWIPNMPINNLVFTPQPGYNYDEERKDA